MTDVTRYDKLTIEDAWKIIKLQEYNFPKKPSSDGYYHIYVKDSTKKSGRRSIKAKTLEELKDKVYKNDCVSFKNIFYIIQKEKIKYIKNKEKLLSVENTISKNKSEYKRFFEGTHFEQKPITVITKQDIEKFILNALVTKDLNNKAFLSLRTILSSVFKYAYNEYIILENPYTRIDFSKYKDLIVPTVPSSKRFHSDEEIERMLEFIHFKQHEIPDMVSSYALEFQIVTGMRRGEIPPLTFNDVKDGYILINKQLIGTTTVSHTKNYKERKFPITKDVQICLDKIQWLHDNYFEQSEYLFPGLNISRVYGLYKRMCKKLGIIMSRDLMRGPHSFRRNGITKVTNNSNGNISLACEIYGNTPEVAKQNYYTGIDIDKAREILELQSVTK